MELVARSYQELRAGTTEVSQSRSIRGDGNPSRPARTGNHCLARVDRQRVSHYLLRRCGAQPTPDRASRNQNGEHDHGVQHRPVATTVLFALWRGSGDGRRDRWSVRRDSKVYGRGDRGTAQSRGEICDLGIRLHLELLSHEFLINPGVLYRAGAVAGGGKSEHELLRRTSRNRIGVGKPTPPCHALRTVACLRRTVGKEFDRLLILKSQSRSV